MTTALDGTPVVFVNVAERERALGFYRDVLGLELRSSDEHRDFFNVGPALMRLTAIPGHVAGPHPVLGWNVADADAAVDELARRGVVFAIYEGMGQDARGVWTSPDGTAKVAWFTDPDGNVLSISQA